MLSQDAFIENLRQDAAARRVALILGAGFSAATVDGQPPGSSWMGLLRDGVDFVRDFRNDRLAGPFLQILEGDPGTEELLAVAQWLRSQFNGIPGEYANWLQRTIGSLQPMQDAQLAASLPETDHVATTNYDTLWSARFADREAMPWTEPYSLPKCMRAPRKYVFHLHGVYSHPESVILSGEDYGRLANKGTAQEYLRHVASSHSLLLVGFGNGLDDPTFSRILLWLQSEHGGAPHRHYLLVTRGQLQSLDLPSKLQSRLTPIAYGEAFRDLPSFLTEAQFPAVDDRAEAALYVQHDYDQDVEPSSESRQDLIRAGLPAVIVDYLESKDQLGAFDRLSDFQRSAIHAIARLIDDGLSSLLFTVTGTGKTTLARVAMNAAVAKGKGAMALVPTKALVTQEELVWRDWATTWSELADRSIKVYPASRDYPESDRPVSRGQFDVAIAIYEKLAVFMTTGRQPLTNTLVVVIDEMQMLLEDGERGAKLEALLTMLRLLPLQDRPIILGLSASLRRETTAALQQWLEIDPGQLIETNRRPIPLDAIVVSPFQWVTQEDAHLIGLDGDNPPPPREPERHELSDLAKESSVVLARHLSVASLKTAAVLVDKLLAEDADRRILCFTPTRSSADSLAAAIQGLLRSRQGRASRGCPWRTGRFAGSRSEPESDVKYDRLRYSDLPSAEDVIRGLREGVTAHTAAYPAVFRRLIEEEFRLDDGLLRVIVATDTLAMGVNLPADAVIATAVYGYSGGAERVKRVQSAENVANKAGRAGRMGKTSRERGEFFLIVPRKEELADIHGLGNADIDRLSSLEGVLSTFVTNPKKPPVLKSHYRTLKDAASLVLQVLCQDQLGRDEERTRARIADILSTMLIRYEPEESSYWTVDEVLDELVGRELIGSRPSDGSLALTGLGMALGTSSLDLDLAPTLERIARLSTANAGRIDLLWNACRSFAIQSATAWVSLPPVKPRHLPSMKDAVIQMATALCSESEQKRRDCARSFGSQRYALPEELLATESPVVSPELRELLSSDGEHAADVDVTALLRALVLNEWSFGIPFKEVKARFTDSIVSQETPTRDELVRLRLYYSDVEQLADQVAGVLRGAASIAKGDDGLIFSREVNELASEVELGAPSWLTPIIRMRFPSLHRERLAFLWNLEPPEELRDVLEMPEVKDHMGVALSDIAGAKETLDLRAAEAQTQKNRLARRWMLVRIPSGEGESFGDVSDDLTAATSSTEYLGKLNWLAQCLNIDVSQEIVSGFHASAQWSAGSRKITIFVPHGDITGESFEEVRMTLGIVITRTRATITGNQALRRAHAVRAVEPEHFVTVIARLVDMRGAGVLAEEVIDFLEAIPTSSIDSETWIAHDGPLAMPPPFIREFPRLDPVVQVETATEKTAE